MLAILEHESCCRAQATAITAQPLGKMQLFSALFLQMTPAASEAVMEEFGPQSPANISWASGKIGWVEEASSHAIARRSLLLAFKPSPQQLSNIVWPPGTVMTRDDLLVSATIKAMLVKMEEPAPQNASNTVQ